MTNLTFNKYLLPKGLTIRPATSIYYSQTRKFSATKTKRVSPEPFVTAATVLAQMTPQINWAVLVMSNLSIVIAGIYNIAGDWNLGFIDSLFSTNPGTSTEIQNWELAVDVYRSLTNTLHQGVNGLRVIMPEILPTSTMEVQDSLLFGLRGLDHLTNVAFHEVMVWSDQLYEVADFNADFSDLANDLDNVYWPRLRAAGNDLRDLIRYIEQELHLVPSDRTPWEWFED